jgi:hypothetical protein
MKMIKIKKKKKEEKSSMKPKDKEDKSTEHAEYRRQGDPLPVSSDTKTQKEKTRNRDYPER